MSFQARFRSSLASLATAVIVAGLVAPPGPARAGHGVLVAATAPRRHDVSGSPGRVLGSLLAHVRSLTRLDAVAEFQPREYMTVAPSGTRVRWRILGLRPPGTHEINRGVRIFASIAYANAAPDGVRLRMGPTPDDPENPPLLLVAPPDSGCTTLAVFELAYTHAGTVDDEHSRFKLLPGCRAYSTAFWDAPFARTMPAIFKEHLALAADPGQLVTGTFFRFSAQSTLCDPSDTGCTTTLIPTEPPTKSLVTVTTSNPATAVLDTGSSIELSDSDRLALDAGGRVRLSPLSVVTRTGGVGGRAVLDGVHIVGGSDAGGETVLAFGSDSSAALTAIDFVPRRVDRPSVATLDVPLARALAAGTTVALGSSHGFTSYAAFRSSSHPDSTFTSVTMSVDEAGRHAIHAARAGTTLSGDEVALGTSDRNFAQLRPATAGLVLTGGSWDDVATRGQASLTHLAGTVVDGALRAGGDFVRLAGGSLTAPKQISFDDRAATSIDGDLVGPVTFGRGALPLVLSEYSVGGGSASLDDMRLDANAERSQLSQAVLVSGGGDIAGGGMLLRSPSGAVRFDRATLDPLGLQGNGNADLNPSAIVLGNGGMGAGTLHIAAVAVARDGIALNGVTYSNSHVEVTSPAIPSTNPDVPAHPSQVFQVGTAASVASIAYTRGGGLTFGGTVTITIPKGLSFPFSTDPNYHDDFRQYVVSIDIQTHDNSVTLADVPFAYNSGRLDIGPWARKQLAGLNYHTWRGCGEHVDQDPHNCPNDKYADQQEVVTDTALLGTCRYHFYLVERTHDIKLDLGLATQSDGKLKIDVGNIHTDEQLQENTDYNRDGCNGVAEVVLCAIIGGVLFGPGGIIIGGALCGAADLIGQSILNKYIFKYVNNSLAAYSNSWSFAIPPAGRLQSTRR